ncbi:MAG TPA: hypothetical protein DCX53_02445 [Anaerolineae bacterium]|nr:hypothetical protein [Anaerolineae bacterium]
MKNLLFGYIMLTLFLASCAPQTPTEPPSIIIEQPGNGEPSSGETLSPVEYAVVEQLSENLGLSINDITVRESKSTEFSDACLGVVMQDVLCAQVITPGYIILLEAGDIQYEYHTSEDGSRIQPATLALTWSRDGGIAGFCDRLTVFLSGEVYGNQCNMQDGRMETFASLLSGSERSQFDMWMKQYGQMTLDASDPKGVADGMSLILVFIGMGESMPGKTVEQEMLSWAQDLFQRLYE